MAGIDWRNMSLRILSVLLALLLWVYATNEQNPVHNQILSINLTQRGLPENMVVSNDIPRVVSVRVQGTRGQVTALTPSDFEAVLDLSKVTEGEQYLPVKVNAPQGVQITQVTPGRVNAVVEDIVEQQINLKATLKGSPAKGYTAMDPVVLPAAVTVRGPRSKVAAISQVNLTVDVESAAAQVEKTLPVIVDQSGVTVNPKTVKVTVPITQLPSKLVPVRARATGTPARDFEVDGITIKPAEVLVAAPQAILAGINWIETENVDVKGADHDINVKIGVSPPQGVVEIKPATVDVTVQLKKAKTPQPPAGDVKPTTGVPDRIN